MGSFGPSSVGVALSKLDYSVIDPEFLEVERRRWSFIPISDRSHTAHSRQQPMLKRRMLRRICERRALAPEIGEREA
jgi:hypothetical protein